MPARRKRLPKDLSTMVGDGENPGGATQITNPGVSRGKPQESNVRMWKSGQGADGSRFNGGALPQDISGKGMPMPTFAGPGDRPWDKGVMQPTGRNFKGPFRSGEG